MQPLTCTAHSRTGSTRTTRETVTLTISTPSHDAPPPPVFLVQKNNDTLRTRMTRIEAALGIRPTSSGASTACTTARNRIRMRRKVSTSSSGSSDTPTSHDGSSTSGDDVGGRHSPPRPSPRTCRTEAALAATARQHVVPRVRVVTGSGRLLLGPVGTVSSSVAGSSLSSSLDTSLAR